MQTEQWERMKLINRLIKCEQTGTPKEFAKRLGISESHLYRILDELHDFGLKFHYDRTRHTYYYEEDMELALAYSVKIIAGHEQKEIFGGYVQKNCFTTFL